MNDIRKKSLKINNLEKRLMLDASLGGLAGSVVMAENDVNAAPQIIDNNVTITGSTIDFTGLSLDITTSGNANDQLSIRHEGTTAGQIGFNGTNVTYGGLLIGTITANGANGGTLSILLNGDASQASIERLIENVTYANNSDDPVLNRNITFTLDEFFSESVTITIAPQNDAPVINANTGMTLNEGATRVLTSTMLNITDGDNTNAQVTINVTTGTLNGRLELTTNTGVAISSFTLADLNNGHVQYVHNDSETTSDSFVFQVTDGELTLAGTTFNITVVPVNDAPVLTNNTGADVYTGLSTTIGGKPVPTQFGTEILRLGTGTQTSFHGSINGNFDSQISIIFTTGASMPTSTPGQVIFETGSNATGISLILNQQNQLEMYFGTGTVEPRIISPHVLGTSTQYAVVLEYDTIDDQVRMHYAQAGNFNWFTNGRAPESMISGWTSTTFAANSAAGVGVLNGTIGGYSGATSGVTAFQGTINSDLVITRVPATLTTLRNTNLVYTDVDTTATNLVYTITNATDYGTLYRSGVALGLGNTFTQADLNNGLITYTHGGGATGNDSFSFSINDGANTINSSYDIRVISGNTAPTITTTDLYVAEESKTGDVIGYARATDPDLIGGQTLSWSVQGGTGQSIFAINSTTGAVIVTNGASLDYETTTSYTLTIRATDSGAGNLYDQRTITINIQDIYEGAAPVITSLGPYYINENVGNNTNVGTITATDADGDNITYSIVSGNTNTAFKINATTGLIQVSGTDKIDFETTSTYNLVIRATDNSVDALFSQRTITIHVNDLNEGPSLQIDEVIRAINIAYLYNPSNGNFYRYYATSVNFATAMTNASNAMLNGANGHLVTITSAAENTFVDNMIGNNTWLAASDDEVEGQWKWLAGPEAGSVFSIGPNATAGFYENWNGPEPNNGNAANNAYIATNGTWYDSNATGGRFYVVEWESFDVINNRLYSLNYTATNGADITNGTSIGFVQGGDDDNDVLTYSITGGNSDGIFEIDALTGELRIADNTNIDTSITSNYTITVRVDDGSGLFDTKDMVINFNQLFSVGTNSPLSVLEGGTSIITTAQLDILDGDTADSDLVITITTQPAHGHIAYASASSASINSFTQDDIVNNRVIFVSDGSENTSDSFTFSVTDGATTIAGQVFTINITNVNDAPSVSVNTGATVLEGGNIIITNAMLSASDPDDAPGGLTFTATTINNGLIRVNGVTQNTFTQDDINNSRVVFVHNGSENNASFIFIVADGGEDGAGTAGGTFNLTRTPVNDSPVITTNTGTSVLEGGTQIITTTMLNVTDPDDSGTGITYTLSNIQNGQVELTTAPGIPVVTFTQANLNANQVLFRHDGNEFNGTFTITVTDGGEDGSVPAVGTFTLTKIDVNDAPIIAVNTGTSVNQNSVVILKRSVLLATDPDDTATGLTYTITGVTDGQLEYISNPGVAIMSFTQADINNSLVLFRHSGPPGTASFNFSLADGGENGAMPVTGIFNFSVDNINDPPSITTNVTQTIDRGTTLNINTTMLDSFDSDDFGVDLTWTITNLQSGTLRVNGVITNTFTQADLDNGLVSFTHDGSQTRTAGFTATVADGGENNAAPARVFFNLNINASNTAPHTEANTGATVDEGGTVTIVDGNLDIGDADERAWYNANWQYRQQITIDNAYVSADLVDFVLLINGSNFSSNFWANVKNDGSDIVITLGDGTTKLARELVSINRAAGTMELHVKIPLLSASADTQLFIYFGNGAGAETNNAVATFSNYNHVYHMNQINPVDVVGARNGVNNSGGSITTGTIGNGQSFVDNGNIDIATINGASIRTVSFWYDANGTGGGAYGTILGGIDYNDGIRHLGDNPLSLRRGGVEIVSTTASFDLKHLVFSYDSAAGTMTLYENGILQDTGAFSGWYNFEFLVGIAGATNRAINGSVDEIRLSSQTMSAAWAAAEYANQSNPSSFISLSGRQHYQPQTLSYSVSALPANGTLFIDSNNDGIADAGEVLAVSGTFTQADITAGRLKYVHDGGETTSDSFQFRLYDGTDYSAVQTFNLTINPVNDAPTIVTNITQTIDEGASLTLDSTMLDPLDPDDSGTGLTWTISGLSNGHLEVDGVTQNTFTQADLDAGLVVFVHDGSETTSASFNFSLADGGEDGSVPATGTFNIIITPVNENVVLVTNTGAGITESGTVTITNAHLNTTDVDDTASGITYTVTSTTNGWVERTTDSGWPITTFTQNDINLGRIVFRHDGSGGVNAGFDFSVIDGGENGTTAVTGTFDIDVTTAVNVAPVIAITDGAPTTIDFGSVTILPYDAAGVGDGQSSSLTEYIISDDGSVLTIYGNSWKRIALPMTLTPNTVITFDFRSTREGEIHGIGFDDDDTIGNGVSAYALFGTDDTNPRFDYSYDSYSLGNGWMRYEINIGADFTGAVTHMVFVADDDAGADAISQYRNVSIYERNPSISVTEGGSFTITNANLNAFDTDDAPGDLTYTASALSGGTIRVNGVTQNTFTQADVNAGLVVFIHDGGEAATASFNLSLADGGENGAAPDTATFTLNVTPVNDAPVITGDLALSVNEGGNVTITVADLGYTDPDDAAADVTYTISNITNGHIEVNGVTQNTFTAADIANGLVVFIHDGSETTSAGFDISLADGGEDGAQPDTASMSITVTPVNDAPVITGNLSMTINEGASATITATYLGYTDPDNLASELIFTISNLSNGVIQVNGVTQNTFSGTQLTAGQVVFIHDGSETLSAGFDISLSDGTATDTASMDITITPVNDAPVITGDLALSVNEGASVTITVADLGYTDPDDAATDVTYTISNITNGHIEVNGVTQNTFTAADIANGLVVFIHDGSETTSAGFDISLADGGEDGAQPDTASMSITVTPVNDAPTAIALSANSIMENAIVGSVIGTLSTTDADLPGDTFTYTIMNDPDGKFIIVGNQLRLNDTLDYGAATQHSVTIRTDDGNGGTFDETFIINVEDNTPPTAVLLDNDTVPEDAALDTLVGILSASDDNSGESFTYTLIDNPGNAFAIDGDRLVVAGALNATLSPTITITVQVTDSAGNTFDQILTLTIEDVPDPSTEEPGTGGNGTIENPRQPDSINTQNTNPFALFSAHNKRDLFYVGDILEPERHFSSHNLIEATLSGTRNAGDIAFYGMDLQILRQNTTILLQDILTSEANISLPVSDDNDGSGMEAENFAAQSGAQQPTLPLPDTSEFQQDYNELRDILLKLQGIEPSDSENSGNIRELVGIDKDFQDVMAYQEQKQAALRKALSGA